MARIAPRRFLSTFRISIFTRAMGHGRELYFSFQNSALARNLSSEGLDRVFEQQIQTRLNREFVLYEVHGFIVALQPPVQLTIFYRAQDFLEPGPWRISRSDQIITAHERAGAHGFG